MASNNSSGCSSIVLLILISFGVMAWSVSNPVQASSVVDTCVSSFRQLLTALGETMDEYSEEKEK